MVLKSNSNTIAYDQDIRAEVRNITMGGTHRYLIESDGYRYWNFDQRTYSWLNMYDPEINRYCTWDVNSYLWVADEGQ